jgi:hypothetical protein
VSKRGQLCAIVGNCKQLWACVGYRGQWHDPLIKKMKRSNFIILWEELLTTMMIMVKELPTVDQNNKNNTVWVCLDTNNCNCASSATVGNWQLWAIGNCGQLANVGNWQMWAIGNCGQLATVGNCEQLQACVGYCGEGHDPLIRKVKRLNFSILCKELLTTRMIMMKELPNAEQKNKNMDFWVCLGICWQVWTSLGAVGNSGHL